MKHAAVALTELERDALTELVNIGVSRAAVALRKMIGEPVLLSVPAVEVLDHSAAATLISEREGGHLVAVKLDFSGALSGRAMLIFPQASSIDLVRAVADDAVSADQVADLEEEALAETGNVILNRCLGTIANMLRRSLSLSLPEVLRGDGADLFASGTPEQNESLVLFLYINFFVKTRNIRGYIAMLLDLPSLAALKELIAEFIATALGEAEPVATASVALRPGAPHG